MSYGEQTFRPREYTAADQAAAGERAAFVQRTYLHLMGAVLAFIGIEFVLLQLPVAGAISALMTNGMSWLIVLAAFMGVSYLANRWAMSDTSVAMQYVGLSVFVVAEAFLFLPLLYVAAFYGSPRVIPVAGVVTACVFIGLTSFTFFTRKDFSFLAPILGIAGFGALGVIVVAILFGFNLGVFFTVVMIVFAAGYVLYDTSNVLHHYRTDQHVAASLALFSSIALLFWYILRLLMSRD